MCFHLNAKIGTLLDEMDPLRSTKPMTIMKTPQSFLGENSSLVNLDQLLKSSSTSNNGLAYNPFGDLPQPQKPNLFQQQTQPVSFTTNLLENGEHTRAFLTV